MSTIETEMDRNSAEAGRTMNETDLSEREPRAIEEEIDATRADMRATLEALEHRFSFERLVDLTVGRIKDRGGEFAVNLTDAAARNPMPLVLTSIGLAWLMWASRSGNGADPSLSHSSLGGGRLAAARDTAGHAAGKVQGAAASARDSLHHAADSSRAALRSAADSSRQAYEQAREKYTHAADSLRTGASSALAATRNAGARMDRLLHEQPLMLGALGLAAGAIIGALLPMTEQEDRYVGPARQKALKTIAEQTRARVESLRDAAKESISEAAGETDTPGRESTTARRH
jgi:ElaB/YqjD/DUF883 family membrane-anchored ribosome-binding protein